MTWKLSVLPKLWFQKNNVFLDFKLKYLMEISRLYDILEYTHKNHPREDYLVTKIFGEWEPTSTTAAMSMVNNLSKGLLAMGVQPGDKVAIITTNNCTPWHIVDFALQQIGVVSVPIYSTITDEDTEFVLNNSETKFCFVSEQELYDKITRIKESVPTLVSTYCFENIKGIPYWKEIIEQGKETDSLDEVYSIKNGIQADDLVTLIYTSGTTGKPKGVMLTHRNILSNIMNSIERVPPSPTDHTKTLSFLPICHIFERMITYLYQYQGYSIYFAESIEKIGDNVKEVQPEFMTVVPRLVEKVYAKIYEKGTTAGGLKSKIFMWALGTIKNYVPYGSKSIGHRIADALVFKKWREGLGGNMICLISGSAALSQELAQKFFAAGIPILEGYGLTETSPVISVNTFGKNGFRLGSVGKVLANEDVKLGEDSEILVKGSNVFQGYYKDEAQTAQAFDEEGYFKTGDIGKFEEGFLFITDRKKDYFKTSGGKYVAPQKIENDLKLSRFIEQAMVVGEGQKMPCAIIQPDFEFIRAWMGRKNIEGGTSDAEIASNPTVRERIMKEVEAANKKFGNWEKIKMIELTPEPWTIEEGLLTPTLKLKRKAIRSRYEQLYDKMYRE